jgi:branched-chain amino acid transport system substrate-binding protein
LFAHLQSQLPEKRPLRIGTVSTQGLAGYVDQVNGVVALAKAYPDRFAVVSQQWVDNQPVTVTNQIREMAKDKPDLVLVGTNTAQVVATAKALKELGMKTPIVTSSHNGLNEAAKAIPIADLEGSYSVFAFAPYNDANVKAGDIFNKYNKTKGTWGITSAQTAGQALLAVAAIERAASKVGADKITGQAVYDALLAGPFDANLFQGLLPTLALKRDAPFPTDNLAVKAMTVKGGQLVAVSRDWMPVPALAKW